MSLESLWEAVNQGNRVVWPDDSWEPAAGTEVVAPKILALVRADTRPALFDYQRELASQLRDRFLRDRSRLILSLPTGGGKTRTAICGLLSALSLRGDLRVFWLAPTKELLNQAFSEFCRLWQQTGSAPDVAVAHRRVVIERPSVSFITPQQVRPGMAADIVVFDEAHQVAAPTFRRTVTSLLEKGELGALVGLSATPGRVQVGEGETLVEMFDGHMLTSPLLGDDPVRELQNRGVLSQLRFSPLSRRAPDSIQTPERIRIASRAVRLAVAEGSKTLVFCESVAAARVTAAHLQTKGVRASFVDGGLPDRLRQERLAMFADGRIEVLANQKLLTAGYDLPAVSTIVLQRLVGSPIEFEQIVGRAARGPLTGGSASSRVWQFEDHLALHGLPTSYYRYRDYGWRNA